MIIDCPAERPSAPAGVPSYPEEVGEVVSLFTPRRQEIAALIAVGLSNAELVRRRVITEGTVVNHTAAIVDKLGH